MDFHAHIDTDDDKIHFSNCENERNITSSMPSYSSIEMLPFRLFRIQSISIKKLIISSAQQVKIKSSCVLLIRILCT